MSLFVESIRIENGQMPLLHLHQSRLEHTLVQHGSTSRHNLKELIEIPPQALPGIYKCRVTYSPEKVHDIQFIKYQVRRVETISTVDIGDRDYSFKFDERTWIEEFKRRSGTDEIIMCQSGRITDASYANLVFYDGDQWITPSRPLLRGVKRQQLLMEKSIVEEDLRLEDLHRFSHVRLINAMMNWEESPVLDLNKLL